jgi:hypothetical protein
MSTKQIFRVFPPLCAVSSREVGLGASAQASNSDFLKFMSDSLLTFHFGAALVNSGFSIYRRVGSAAGLTVSHAITAAPGVY